MSSLFIRNAAQLVPVGGPDRARAGAAQGRLQLIRDGAVYCEGERIVAVGTTRKVLRDFPRAKCAQRIVDASGRAVLPGLIDCHAHPVFAGDRSDEYALRLAGKSYREILAGGGGILKTVRHVRAASHSQLLANLQARLDAALRLGTTTLEAKSGYGLDEATERKMLEVIRLAQGRPLPPMPPQAQATPLFLSSPSHPGKQAGRLDTVSQRQAKRSVTLRSSSSVRSLEKIPRPRKHPIDLVPTLLHAHAVPLGRSAGEIAAEAAEAAPRLAPLAEFVDVFCERGIFDVAQSRRVLEAGQAAGLKAKVHADEMCLLGGAKLAAGLGAVSADHLLFTDGESIRAMQRAGTIAVLLPGTPFVLRVPYADARRFIAGDVPVAVASDLNPNCFSEALPFAFALAVYEMKMTPAEALVAMTINAAAALCRAREIGSLKPGKLADLVILHGPSFLHLGYHLGGNPVKAVIKRGKVVVWSDT